MMLSSASGSGAGSAAGSAAGSVSGTVSSGNMHSFFNDQNYYRHHHHHHHHSSYSMGGTAAAAAAAAAAHAAAPRAGNLRQAGANLKQYGGLIVVKLNSAQKKEIFESKLKVSYVTP